MYEAYETSNPYFVGVSNGDIIFDVDTLVINRETNQQEIVTHRFIHDYTHAEIITNLNENTKIKAGM